MQRSGDSTHKTLLKIQMVEKKAELHRAEELTQNALAVAHAANATAFSQEMEVLRLKLEHLENEENGPAPNLIDDPENTIESNYLRSKNTGIGATNMWSGNHIRFQDDINHFKAMVWGWKGDREATMARFHDIGFHYVDLYSGDPENMHAISSRRLKQTEKVQVGDRIHTYSGAADTGVHYRGTVLSVYAPVTQQNLDEHLPAVVRTMQKASSVWRRCQVEWDLDTELTTEWRSILTQPGCGTIIPLKIP